MAAFVLPRMNGASGSERIAHEAGPTVRAPVVATFDHGGARWSVDGDTRFEPLILASADAGNPSTPDPFCFREAATGWALALRPDLYAQLTLPGDRGAGRLFAYASKKGQRPSLRELPPLSKQRRRRSVGGGYAGPTAFDPAAAPNPRAVGADGDPVTRAALLEKANQGHHQILVRLFQRLVQAGWRDIEQFPLSIDLWARHPDGERVLFEAKTISATNEVSQCRRGLAQLLEYRLEIAGAADSLCLVTDAPVSPKRASILERLDVAVLAIPTDEVLLAGGAHGARLANRLEVSPTAGGRKTRSGER